MWMLWVWKEGTCFSKVDQKKPYDIGGAIMVARDDGFSH